MLAAVMLSELHKNSRQRPCSRRSGHAGFWQTGVGTTEPAGLGLELSTDLREVFTVSGEGP